MNTGELIECFHQDGSRTMEPVIWCDLCGWGARHTSNPDDVHHFCHRHKEPEIQAFLDGKIKGYFQLEKEEENNGV